MGQAIHALSRGMAWLGAAVLALLAALSVVSIVGRTFSAFGLGPVPGDFELVEAGAALAVFCFMPWAHLKRGHAVVDLLWRAYPRPMQRGLEIATDGLMLVAWLLLTWRLGVAMLEYRANGEVSFILQMPVWFGYCASFVAAVLGLPVYLWRLLESLGLVDPADIQPAAALH